MKIPRIHISERQQVLLIIPVAIVAIVAIWYFVLRPQYQRRSEIDSLRQQLAKSPYVSQPMNVLLEIADHERRLGEETEAEWRRTKERLSTLSDQNVLRRDDKVGRIDYKKELFQVRMRLARRSEELHVQLIPQDLGLSDALGGKESEVRVRMLQLRTIERLVDTILSLHAFKLHSIEPMAPIPHKGADKKLLYTEYPVQVDFEVAFDDLYLFFQSTLESERVFAIRNVRVSAGTAPSAPLRVQAVMSALLFE